MRIAISLLGLALLTGCNSTLNTLREHRFANQPHTAIEVQPSALSLGLAATPNGQSLTPASLEALNQLLLRQGRLPNQHLTLLPHTPAGDRIAQRLGQALRGRGLPGNQLVVETVRLQPGADDLTVLSEALVVQAPTCTIAAPEHWAIAPYSAIGSLGCANEANLAAMVSNPQDLVAPALLGPGDGTSASSAVQRYHEHDLPELLDMTFKQK
ncbi:hypothetical protein ALP05_03222 [Pseudomonas caricapapayae]|uniref:Pilus assembly protein CpaD n=1 Tax=Pseudomonas caricapapayae TaxID=46678 RepID=A0A3M6EWS1_9PSED|nr:CpaD family pilus assembly lipoprotein [Pseudomonas caricapapayae]RMV72779.1 hypothetical protein ALP05_03222 [Pseudomonas caricapapayae]